MEIKSRGLEMPLDYQNLLSTETKTDKKWRLGGNGYFLRADGKQYIPTEQQEGIHQI